MGTLSHTSTRRTAFAKIAAATALIAAPTVASADGAVSAATISRAKGIYGDRIFSLKPAVEAGDFKAVIDEKRLCVVQLGGLRRRQEQGRQGQCRCGHQRHL